MAGSRDRSAFLNPWPCRGSVRRCAPGRKALAYYVGALVLLCTALGPARATANAIGVEPKSGPPTSTITADGAAFPSGAFVDIYFDTQDRCLVRAGRDGSFNCRFSVPGSAKPGYHWISAVVRGTAIGGQTRFNVNTNWVQFGFSAKHNGYNPYENVIDVANVGSLGVAWVNHTGVDFRSSPAVVNGVLYVGSLFDYALDAYSAGDGHRIWRRSLSGAAFSSPAVAKGVVYIGAYGQQSNDLPGTIYAFRARDGKLLWSRKTGGGIYSSPTVADGVVFFGSLDRYLYALRASDGSLVWKVRTAGRVYSSPAVANGMVYVGSTDYSFYAYSQATGALVWQFRTGNEINYASPAVYGGNVYFASADGKLYACNALTGVRQWDFATAGVVTASPVVADSTVYIGSRDNSIYALNAFDGAKKWQFRTGGFVQSTAALLNQLVLVGSDDGNLYALGNTNGALLWKQNLGGPVVSSPAVTNGVVFDGAYGGDLVAFRPDLGTRSLTSEQRPELVDLTPDYTLAATGWRR